MLKNVRIWFKKTGPAIYTSHLDLNRCMLRAIQKSKISVWRTEGFNPHPFITFSLPLSLGFSGLKESMDTRLIDEISFDDLVMAFNNSLPEGIEVTGVTEPVMKPAKIAFASFLIVIKEQDKLFEKLNSFFEQEEIITEKKTKKGTKSIDLKEYVRNLSIKNDDGQIVIDIVLPAGNTTNINPNLFFNAFSVKENVTPEISVTRTNIYCENMEEFA